MNTRHFILLLLFLAWARSALAQLEQVDGTGPGGLPQRTWFFTPPQAGRWTFNVYNGNGQLYTVNNPQLAQGVRTQVASIYGSSALSFTVKVFGPDGLEWHPEQPDEPITGDLDLSGFDSVDFEMRYDSDGDGTLDAVTNIGNYSTDDSSFTTPPIPDGAAYEIVATAGHQGEVTIPLNQVVHSGGGSGGGSGGTVVVSGDSAPPIQTVTIDPQGNIQQGAMQVTQVESGSGSSAHTSTVYTYNNSSGGHTSVVYSGNGTTTAQTSDVREQTAQNSAENEAILAELKKHTALLDQIASGTGSVPNVGAPSDPNENYQEPDGNPHEQMGTDLTVKAESAFTEMNGIVTDVKEYDLPMPVVTTGYGSTLNWSFTLPVVGALTCDLTGYSTYINAWREFLKFVLSLIAWAVCVRIFRGTFV